jgi:DNA-binding NtrC family response regulator
MSPSESRPRRPLILVVDRSEDIRGYLHSILTDRGFRVLLASTAADALRIVARLSHRINLVIAEVRMPWKPGLDFVAHVGQILPELPVLPMSSDLIERATGSQENTAHGGGFVARPFTRAFLLSKLQSLMAAPPNYKPTRYRTASRGR